MGYSETLPEGADVPRWASYAVVVCHSHTRPERPARDMVQYFTSRRDGERFAREISRHFPARTGDELTLWALVYAMSATGRERIATSGVCYLAYDPGGTLLKRHAIEPGYGVRAARTYSAACVCCA